MPARDLQHVWRLGPRRHARDYSQRQRFSGLFPNDRQELRRLLKRKRRLLVMHLMRVRSEKRFAALIGKELDTRNSKQLLLLLCACHSDIKELQRPRIFLGPSAFPRIRITHFDDLSEEFYRENIGWVRQDAAISSHGSRFGALSKGSFEPPPIDPWRFSRCHNAKC